MDYLTWKWLHVVSSTVLFGTGIGTAFAMFTANRSGDVRAIATVARNVVRADWLFTLPAVMAQPVTGLALLQLAGLPLSTPWIVLSFVLYAIAVVCWVPVVFLQIWMRDMAAEAAASGVPLLSGRYWRVERAWVLLGIPAFFSLLTVFWLMIAKPALF